MTNGNPMNINSDDNRPFVEFPLEQSTESNDIQQKNIFEEKVITNIKFSSNESKVSSDILPVAQIKTIEDKTTSKNHHEPFSNPDKIHKKGISPHKDVQLSREEIDLLTRIVRAEAQTEPMEGKIAVACVVLNRVKSPQFPNTVKEVIYQRNQFQPVMNGEINKPADKDSLNAVYTAISEHHHIADESLFFYNPKIATSRWLDSKETTVAIGQHVFKK